MKTINEIKDLFSTGTKFRVNTIKNEEFTVWDMSRHFVWFKLKGNSHDDDKRMSWKKFTKLFNEGEIEII